MARACDGRRLLVVGVVLIGCVSGCATSTSGHAGVAQDRRSTIGPTGPTRFPPSSTQLPSTPQVSTPPISTPATVTPPTSTVSPPPTPPSTDSSVPPVITVHGADGTPYRAEVLAADRIADCSAHSYGAPIIKYFGAHPCSVAARRLVAIAIGNRIALMSTISVVCAIGPSHDPYKWTSVLYQLERADNTGSVNDLLREGVRVAGVPNSIPSHEGFGVFQQDNVLVIEDAWWESGATHDQDHTLLAAEQNLFPGPLTAP